MGRFKSQNLKSGVVKSGMALELKIITQGAPTTPCDTTGRCRLSITFSQS